MDKKAPSTPMIAVMTVFALSCFAILLFLWITFGGSVPLRPHPYQFKVSIPQASSLALQSDVRTSGISVGRVVGKKEDPKGNRVVATIELKHDFAPIRRDAHAMLRQKSLLGEAYVELTPGSSSAPKLQEGATLPARQVRPNVTFDQILEALDPQTRQFFRIWQQQLARGVSGHGEDLNGFFGNLPQFTGSGADLFAQLDAERRPLGQLVRGTGQVFSALSRDNGRLRDLVTNSATVFRTTAAQNRALARSFEIFPTFLRESRFTLNRLESFSRDTDPLIQELRPSVRDLRPTLAAARKLAPDLRTLFNRLGVGSSSLIDVSEKGFPATSDTLRATAPLLNELWPFLSQLNPSLQFIGLYSATVADFIGFGAGGLAATIPSPSGGTGHYLRGLSANGPETVSVYSQREKNNRGNAYLGPTGLAGPDPTVKMIFPEWDCRNAGGEVQATSPHDQDSHPACFVQPLFPFQGRNTKLPHVEADNYER
jgi:phospholipid/cholesterol/gamma-HCH transport system substrate-binding protein